MLTGRGGGFDEAALINDKVRVNLGRSALRFHVVRKALRVRVTGLATGSASVKFLTLTTESELELA